MRKIIAGKLHGTTSPTTISTTTARSRGSRCCILNGSAARTCQPGDQVIICNSVYGHERELTALKPRVLTFDKDNRVVDHLIYSVERDAVGGYSFSILDVANKPLPLPALVAESKFSPAADFPDCRPPNTRKGEGNEPVATC